MAQKRKGPGRPSKGKEALHGRIQVKLTKEEQKRYLARAKAVGETGSTQGRKLILAWIGPEDS